VKTIQISKKYFQNILCIYTFYLYEINEADLKLLRLNEFQRYSGIQIFNLGNTDIDFNLLDKIFND